MTKDITNEILAAASNEVLADPYLKGHDTALASYVAGLMVGTLMRLMTKRHARIVISTWDDPADMGGYYRSSEREPSS